MQATPRLPRTLLLVALAAPCVGAGAAEAQFSVLGKISDTDGGFDGGLKDADFFGSSVASLGDLDGDGVDDLAVGAIGADEGAPIDFPNRGAVWILFLEADGTVKASQKIDDDEGGFGGELSEFDLFGHSLCALGDVDGDGVVDLAVGAPFSDGGFLGCGAVWLLFLNPDGTVKDQRKIASGDSGFHGLDACHAGVGLFEYYFGFATACAGDVDGNGVPDLFASAPYGFAVGPDPFSHHPPSQDQFNPGSVWLLFLERDGSVIGERKIGLATGGFDGELEFLDVFGSSLAAVGDLDGDGVGELAVGASGDDDGGSGCGWPASCDHGAVWILFLDREGFVRRHHKISETTGGFHGDLDDFDYFATSLAAVGDLDGDGVGDLAVGASNDDDGGPERGAVWILRLSETGAVKAHSKVSDRGGSTVPLDDFGNFGWSAAALGDFDGDGRRDLAVGAVTDDDGGPARGAVWLLAVDPPPPAPSLGGPPGPGAVDPAAGVLRRARRAAAATSGWGSLPLRYLDARLPGRRGARAR